MKAVSAEEEIRWEDVTNIFDEAAKDMEPGQMLPAPTFRLFEAMSAMEVMIILRLHSK